MSATADTTGLSQQAATILACVARLCELHGFASIKELSESLALPLASTGQLAAPLRELEDSGKLVRFRLGNGSLAWGFAP